MGKILREIAASKPESGTWTLDWVNDWLEETSGIHGVHLQIPIHLPHGAIVTQLSAYIRHQTSPDTMVVGLWYCERNTGNGAVMTAVDSTTTMEERTDNTLSEATIDNENRCYNIQLDANQTNGEKYYRSIRITYTVIRC